MIKQAEIAYSNRMKMIIVNPYAHFTVYQYNHILNKQRIFSQIVIKPWNIIIPMFGGT